MPASPQKHSSTKHKYVTVQRLLTDIVQNESEHQYRSNSVLIKYINCIIKRNHYEVVDLHHLQIT